MKKLMAALLLLVAMSSVASAQPGLPYIGISSDAEGIICQADVTQYVATQVYVLAYLPPDIEGITAAEFRIDNLPTEAMSINTFDWNTDLVIGSPGYGIALAFPDPLMGPLCLLGTISFFPLADFGPDWRMTIMPSNDSGNNIVVDLDFIGHPCSADPFFFTFNCTGALPGGCDCTVGIATEDATWGQIKALY